MSTSKGTEQTTGTNTAATAPPAKRQKTSSRRSYFLRSSVAPIFSSTKNINNVPVEVWKEHFCQKFLKIDPLSSSLPVPHVLQITLQYIIVGTGLYLYINTSEDTTAENAIKPATEADPRTAPFNSNSNDDSFGDGAFWGVGLMQPGLAVIKQVQ